MDQITEDHNEAEIESHADWAIRIQRERMVVSPFQAKAALHQAGMLQAVEEMMEHPGTAEFTRLAWSSASEFRRLSPMVVEMASTLNLTDQQLDDLFKLAATISA